MRTIPRPSRRFVQVVLETAGEFIGPPSPGWLLRLCPLRVRPTRARTAEASSPLWCVWTSARYRRGPRGPVAFEQDDPTYSEMFREISCAWSSTANPH